MAGRLNRSGGDCRNNEADDGSRCHKWNDSRSFANLNDRFACFFGCFSHSSLKQWQLVFYFSTDARRVNRAISHGGIPVQFANCESEPDFRRHFDHIRRSASRVPRTFDALNGSERRNPHLNRIALGSGAKLFEQIANCGRELSLVAGANRRNGRLTFARFYASLHTSKLRG